MDTESYEEAHIPRDLLGDAAPFLQDNMQVKVDLVKASGRHPPSPPSS
jgi:elongation factor P